MSDTTTIKMIFNSILYRKKGKTNDGRCTFLLLEHTNDTPRIYENPHQNDTTGNHIQRQCTTKSQGRICTLKNVQRHVWLTSSNPTNQLNTSRVPSSIRLSPSKIHNRPMDPRNKTNPINPASI